MEVNECINFMLTSTQNAVFNYFKRRLQDFDTTPSQYALLRCLWKQEVQTPSQLAHELHLDTSTITGMLGRLEKKDLIERTYNQEDRRSVHVRLREEGKSIVLITHNRELAEETQRVVTIRDGQVVDVRPGSGVLPPDSLYREGRRSPLPRPDTQHLQAGGLVS